MQEITSEIPLGDVVPNIGTLLLQNTEKFGDHIVYREKEKSGEYHSINWDFLLESVENIAWNLKKFGFEKGDKVVIFSRNCLEMLQLELAIMASGGVAVPIFAYFKRDTAEMLIKHSGAKFLVVAGQYQLDCISGDLGLKEIFTFQKLTHPNFPNLHQFSELLKDRGTDESAIDTSIEGGSVCLNMYTSGTMGTPKCVQLTHGNILSQQAAIAKLWKLDHTDRFLAYLPWHHSFGGIFELFSALYCGATFTLESGYGKDPETIMENWSLVRPTVFFSVPKVYQSLVELTHESKEAEDHFYNSGLKFIFTAAAALPINLSNEFENRGIPVIEGWGLTETSPCCTLTDPNVKRVAGVVGKPIPGVKVRIADDEEIQVKGPNVMVEYYDNDVANKDIFTEDGWFRTGDVGKITETGVQLIARKDRIFKLSNGEKVVPTDLEVQIEKKCHYVQYVVVSGSGEEYPVALIFPNKKLIEQGNYETLATAHCACPKSVKEFGQCLQECLHSANQEIKQKFAKIKSAMVINGELSLDDNTLTPSMKVAPRSVVARYKAHLQEMYGNSTPIEEEIYVVELDPNKKITPNVV